MPVERQFVKHDTLIKFQLNMCTLVKYSSKKPDVKVTPENKYETASLHNFPLFSYCVHLSIYDFPIFMSMDSSEYIILGYSRFIINNS